VTCRLGTLWYALAGAERIPTPEDAGSLLAHFFALWSPLAQINAALRTTLPLTLPQFRLDDWTEEALGRYQGTEAEVMALSCVLRVPVQTVVTWLRQRGKPIPVLTASSNGHAHHEASMQIIATNLAAHPNGRTHSAENGEASPPDQTVLAPEKEKRGTLLWKPAMIKDLTEAFLSSSEPSISATARAIAQQFRWPPDKVEYKIHQLHLPEQRRAHMHQEKRDDDNTQEGD
jgi:hypothetical protein